MAETDSVRYPVGPMERVREPLDEETRRKHIEIIEQAPARIRSLVAGLSQSELRQRYRPDGWTVTQLVHHIADSHLNAYVRMKLAATEATPTVKSYEEASWAELPDAKHGDVSVSVALIDALHRRWIAFLRSLSPAELRRSFRHYAWGEVTIDESITMYSWHCRHHIAHIEAALAQRV
jgi:DinB superfamily